MEALSLLVRAGAPLGPMVASSDAPIDWREVVLLAETTLARRELAERERIAISAWLDALVAHFPSAARRYGVGAVPSVPRDGRFLKQRRIAIANLARLL